MKLRCPWAGDYVPMQDYHDHEWGVPRHDDRTLFEFLVLEGAQAGLSWRTILDKRVNYRRAFHDFDVVRVACMTDAALDRVLVNPGVVRNRLKVWSARTNAQAALRMIDAHGSLDRYLWSFVGAKPLRNAWRAPAEVPTRTALSDHMSKTLAKEGFKFVGSTICYAFMQATGMVDDHLMGCFRHGKER